jgi:two-component system cell cycle response regulator DivK
MERRVRPRPQRVLIVDDMPEIRELWRLWLTYWGFSVQEARNGAEAVRQAQASPPDLVLMDLWMPVLDGLQATRQLKEDKRTAHVPVLALSAQATAPGPEIAAQAGAQAFVQKPCDPDELLDHIRKALSRLRA